MKNLKIFTSLLIAGLALITSCKKDSVGPDIFSVQDNIDLGKQLKAEIESNPEEYPILDSVSYPLPYEMLYEMRDQILASDEINYRDEFAWELKIIRDDNTLNAFAAPGGYIYVYTGLIKYLDSEEQLAGVLGHEIAHSDRRHSTKQMTTQYGASTLIGVLIGDDPGLLTTLAANLVTLSYSRKYERDADEYSVRYLCSTDWEADGAADFFIKLNESGQGGSQPVFLSTHPDPENRVEDIQEQEQELGCTGTETNTERYQELKNSLP